VLDKFKGANSRQDVKETKHKNTIYTKNTIREEKEVKCTPGE
jgi:hypothetical protein